MASPVDRIVIAKFTRRLLQVERDLKTFQVTPRLGNSSIDDGGRITINDPATGSPQVIIGGQYDGTNTVNFVNGPKPPTPTAPIITPQPAGLRLRWDGSFLGDLVDPNTGDLIQRMVAPADFQRVTFHAVPVEKGALPPEPIQPEGPDDELEIPDPGFDPTDSTLIVGELTIAAGGEVTPGVSEEFDYWVYAVAWNRSGGFSTPSAPTVGVPIATVSQAEIDEAKAQATAAATAAADAQTAAGEARQKALQAASTADDAGQAALNAANAAQAAQEAANAAAEAGASNYTELLAAAQAAQAVADAAAAEATAAAQAADAAGALATGAQQSANGKSTVRYSTALPGNAANSVGDTWFQISATHGRTISTWRGLGGDQWAQQTLDGAVISNIDIGTATVGVLSGGRVNAEELVIGSLPLPGVLDSKETPAGAQAKANQAKTDAISAANNASSAQAEAARLAAIAVASGDATDKANAAKAAAIASAATDAANKANAAAATAQAYADTQYATTKTLVSGWVVTGKTTIDGGKIETDTILAGAIKAGEIQTKHLAAETLAAIDIRAENVAAEQAKFGFVLTGKIQVGTSSWTPNEGLIFPGIMILPSQAGQPASFTGGITATTLTVQKDFTLLGNTNKIAGTLTLSNGVTRPTTPPSIYQSWSQRGGARGMEYGPVYYGLAPHLSDSTLLVSATAFYGGSVTGIRKSNNDTVYLHDPKPWGSTGPVGYNPVAITTLGGYYWVLGQDSARNRDWYLYQLNATFDKVSETLIYGTNDFAGRPALGVNGNQLIIGASVPNNTIRVFRYTLNGVGPVTFQGYDDLNTFTNIVNSPLSFIGYSNYDFGSGQNKYVIAVEGNTNFVCLANGDRQSDTYVFPPANGGKVRGLWFDGVNQEFYSWNADGTLWVHGKNTQAQTLSASYTFYDGDSGGTGTHETEETTTPTTGFVRSARTIVTVQGDEAPDSGVTTANTPDKANRIVIYVGVNGGARRRQAYLGVDSNGRSIRALTGLNVIDTGSATPPTSNGFVGAANSPGIIKTFNASGTQGFTVNGDGSGSWGRLQITASGLVSLVQQGPLKINPDGSGFWGNLNVNSVNQLTDAGNNQPIKGVDRGNVVVQLNAANFQRIYFNTPFPAGYGPVVIANGGNGESVYVLANPTNTYFDAYFYYQNGQQITSGASVRCYYIAA